MQADDNRKLCAFSQEQRHRREETERRREAEAARRREEAERRRRCEAARQEVERRRQHQPTVQLVGAWSRSDCQQATLFATAEDANGYRRGTAINCNDCLDCHDEEEELRQFIQATPPPDVLADADPEEREAWEAEAQAIQNTLRSTGGRLQRASGRTMSIVTCVACQWDIDVIGDSVYAFIDPANQQIEHGYYCADCLRGVFAVDRKLWDEIGLFRPD